MIHADHFIMNDDWTAWWVVDRSTGGRTAVTLPPDTKPGMWAVKLLRLDSKERPVLP